MSVTFPKEINIVVQFTFGNIKHPFNDLSVLSIVGRRYIEPIVGHCSLNGICENGDSSDI